MFPFDIKEALLNESGETSIMSMAARMVIASLLGALVAYRPWRRFIKKSRPPQIETAQSQTLMAAAGALMVAVIGDSPARAFGLVGLGAFIRFRTGIKDPRDAVLMFVMIGIGMACGRGLTDIAIMAAVFSIVIMSILDATGPARPSKIRIGIITDDPRAAFPLVRAAFPTARVIDVPSGATAEGVAERGKIVIEIEPNDEIDAVEVMRLLELQKVPGIRNVALEDKQR